MSLTKQLANVFLTNFNYCDAAGKRADTSAFVRFFLNSELTDKLERVANQLVQEFSTEDITFTTMVNLIHHAIVKSDGLRQKYCESRKYETINYGSRSHMCTVVTPKKQSKFEGELKKAITAMRTTLSDNDQPDLIAQLNKEYKLLVGYANRELPIINRRFMPGDET
tara:strand:- start:900 stop:1400 length:501 start_codon:yes stop_codon:yes gene_type:complete